MQNQQPLQDQQTIDFAALVSKNTAEYATPWQYTGMNVTIDLATQQGRWELVVLSLLVAARINETVAERTFSLLRASGLLEYTRVLQQRLADVTQAQEILQSEYRAAISRNKKVMAIYANAKWLAEHYRGDIQYIYDSCFDIAVQPGSSAAQMNAAEAAAAADDLLRRLRQLHQIDNRARWMCRVMVEAGMWPLVPVAATVYFDKYVRCVLQRQGLIPTGDLKSQIYDAEAAIDILFRGDTIGLSRLGKHVCQKHDPVLCAEKCCLYEYCRYRQMTATKQA